MTQPARTHTLWHTSAVVDSLAYGWSWLPPLALLAAYGPKHPDDYLIPFVVLVAVSFAHRHATIPYVALDHETFHRAPYAFTLFPAVLALGFVASLVGYRARWAAGSLGPVHAAAVVAFVLVLLQMWGAIRDGHRFTPRSLWAALACSAAACLGPTGALVGGCVASVLLAWDQRQWLTPIAIGTLSGMLWAVDLRWPPVDLTALQLIEATAIFAGAWNVWHVLQQKYGIFRMYAAKAGGGYPPWVDRFLLFGTLPFVMVGAARHVQPIIDRIGAELALLQPLVDALQGPGALPIASGALALAAAGVFLRNEWLRTGTQVTPRLIAAAGVLALHGSFWLFDPVKVYIAYGVSHAIEYMVFLWAFQRRQYATPAPHDPIMGRIVRRAHGLYWIVLIVGVSAVHVVGYHSDDLWLERPMKLAGVELWRWVFLWGIWQSMAHFYWDSFLWKMRRASTRAAL